MRLLWHTRLNQQNLPSTVIKGSLKFISIPQPVNVIITVSAITSATTYYDLLTEIRDQVFFRVLPLPSRQDVYRPVRTTVEAVVHVCEARSVEASLVSTARDHGRGSLD